MKTKIKIYGIIISALIFTSCAVAGNNSQLPSSVDCDSLETLKLYSLFSEYHKNKDFASALPYGWQVLACDKAKFSKWIYYKMEDCLWYLHDSSAVSPEEVKAIEDSILNFYNMAIQYYPDGMAYVMGLSQVTFQVLAMDPANPSNLYAGTPNNLLTSANGGVSWTAVLDKGPIHTLAIDPQTPSNIYAGTDYHTTGYGIYKSSDGGTTWFNIGLKDYSCHALAIDSKTPSTVYCGAWNLILKTTDGGANWAQVAELYITGYSFITIKTLVIDPKSSTTLYVGAWNTGTFKSTDGGITCRNGFLPTRSGE